MTESQSSEQIQEKSIDYRTILEQVCLSIRLLLALDDIKEKGLDRHEIRARSIALNHVYDQWHRLACKNPKLTLQSGYDVKRCGWLPDSLV